MLRLLAEDAPTLMKSTQIVDNRVIMEKLLGIEVKRVWGLSEVDTYRSLGEHLFKSREYHS